MLIFLAFIWVYQDPKYDWFKQTVQDWENKKNSTKQKNEKLSAALSFFPYTIVLLQYFHSEIFVTKNTKKFHKDDKKNKLVNEVAKADTKIHQSPSKLNLLSILVLVESCPRESSEKRKVKTQYQVLVFSQTPCTFFIQ